MLNVLFVLYHDFTANSAVHVFHWANELSSQGVSCAVAVPENPKSISVLGRPKFTVLAFEELGTVSMFPNGDGPDIVHAWTPRENVRRFCLRLRETYSFRQFIHLEDNEWHLLARMLERPWKTIAALTEVTLDSIVPINLSHPLHGNAFIESADGVTVIIDRLRELVPPNVPTIVLWPSADGKAFSPKSGRYVRSRLSLPLNTTILVYTGNVHAANASEVRSLYLAVAILNREGHPTTLVRAGRDWCPFLGADETWGRAHALELGYVPHTEIPDLLAAADILVQPGKPDAFNDYRLSSKIPEFLATGRPVVLPATNIGLRMTHGIDAFVLPKVDALAIVDAVLQIMGDPALHQKLCSGSRAFFEQHLNWAKSARELRRFYERVTGAPSIS